MKKSSGEGKVGRTAFVEERGLTERERGGYQNLVRDIKLVGYQLSKGEGERESDRR